MRTASRAVPLGDTGVTITVHRDKPTVVDHWSRWINDSLDEEITDKEAIALRDALIERYPLAPDPVVDDAERLCDHKWTTRPHGQAMVHLCMKRVLTSDCDTYGHTCGCGART